MVKARSPKLVPRDDGSRYPLPPKRPPAPRSKLNEPEKIFVAALSDRFSNFDGLSYETSEVHRITPSIPRSNHF